MNHYRNMIGLQAIFLLIYFCAMLYGFTGWSFFYLLGSPALVPVTSSVVSHLSFVQLLGYLPFVYLGVFAIRRPEHSLSVTLPAVFLVLYGLFPLFSLFMQQLMVSSGSTLYYDAITLLLGAIFNLIILALVITIVMIHPASEVQFQAKNQLLAASLLLAFRPLILSFVQVFLLSRISSPYLSGGTLGTLSFDIPYLFFSYIVVTVVLVAMLSALHRIRADNEVHTLPPDTSVVADVAPSD